MFNQQEGVTQMTSQANSPLAKLAIEKGWAILRADGTQLDARPDDLEFMYWIECDNLDELQIEVPTGIIIEYVIAAKRGTTPFATDHTFSAAVASASHARRLGLSGYITARER